MILSPWKSARDLLERLFQARDNRIEAKRFDSNGNFSIGVAEYIDIPGVDYDPEIGIMGFDVSVTLERPGYRVRKRVLKRQKVGRRHIITADEAMEWVKKEFGVEII